MCGDSILPSSSIQAAISRTSNSSKISHYKQGVLQKESILPKDKEQLNEGVEKDEEENECIERESKNKEMQD